MTRQENTRLENLETDVSEIKKDVKSISKVVDRMATRFFKNESTSEVGFFAEMIDTRVRLGKLENFKIAMLFIYGVVWSVIGASIYWVFTK